MSQIVASRSTHLRPALIAAGGVAGSLVALQVVSMIASSIASAAYSLGRLGPGFFEGWFGSYTSPGVLLHVVDNAIPAGIATFLAFGLFFPIRADRGIQSMVVRSLLAGLLACAIITLFSSLYSIAQVLPLMQGPFDRGDAWGVASSMISGFGSAATALVAVVPLILLAGTSIWIWQRRARLTDTPVIG